MKEVLKKNLSSFIYNKKTLDFMSENNIETTYDLCQYSRMELCEKGLENNEVNDVIIKLQLLGLDLKPNHAKRNSLI